MHWKAKNSCDLFYCDIHFIAVALTEAAISPRSACREIRVLGHKREGRDKELWEGEALVLRMDYYYEQHSKNLRQGERPGHRRLELIGRLEGQ